VDPEGPILAVATNDRAPHPVAASGLLTDGGVCLVCHAELHNPRGVPLCTTGPEAATRGPAPGCLACHGRDGDHRFPGTTAEILRSAAQLHVTTTAGAITVSVVNRGSGHALPTGSALRQVVLEVVFTDVEGTELSRHSERFARVLGDAEGNAPVPPWRAVAVARDTRLAPQERRTVTLERPAGATRVRASLVYHRAPPPLLERFGLADHELMGPVVMALAQRTL
jgi:hypothetical protein